MIAIEIKFGNKAISMRSDNVTSAYLMMLYLKKQVDFWFEKTLPELKEQEKVK